ncbi:unnamed protein product [Prorocentrum cordatum]|uniref:GOST seven transmembrane domain-containing protein n=1 Tax=Prorocentrum cordatum TaxID=2364126 RepID=A0ABN9S3Z4_9DINO|nr:unnamed protein product [Polarella glacialis]
MGASTSRWLAAAAALLRWRAAPAQIVEFHDYPAPPPRSLASAYAFFVYNSSGEAPAAPGTPYLAFRARSASGRQSHLGGSGLPTYGGVQITVLRHADVGWLLDLGGGLCSTLDDVRRKRARSAGKLLVERSGLLGDVNGSLHPYGEVFQQMVPFDATAPSDQWPIQMSGVYLLLVSNCGDTPDATISGTARVRHAHGYLPGNEFPKKIFYGWLVLAYGAVGAAWGILCAQWWRELCQIHLCISLVLLLGLGESLLWRAFYWEWNESGRVDDRAATIFTAAMLCTVAKSTLSSTLVLVASLGWGVTRAHLDRGTVRRVGWLSFLHICFSFAREMVLSFRHSHSISVSTVLVIFAPVSLMNVVIFCWVFSAISGVMEKLRKEQQLEKLRLYSALFAVLVAAIGVAAVALTVEMHSMWRPPQEVWQHRWVLTDAVSHLLFLLLLVVTMCLWAPNSQSRTYAYAEQVTGVDLDDHPLDAGGARAEVLGRRAGPCLGEEEGSGEEACLAEPASEA